MKVIIGIDPGLTGAIAILDAFEKNIIQLADMPTMPDNKKRKVSGMGLKKILAQFSPADVEMVYLERVGARPGQGVVSMFSFGRSLGAVEAVVNLLGLPLTYVSPQLWKRPAGLIRADKDASRGKVLDLYPEADVNRKKDSGRADAILIARYGKELRP
ncbi:RuvC family protein [Endozoicomonas euniceicola]|uniref:Uncharacterized protein n=1 Tax=Endozoicomonas euniceicola TaxID=1234143 RepID=A0ABY6GTW7_9GAMM|nr:hypothetical protein [Endozoicomonas euniceicola]UYM16218.1 hypothetical protein NX720_26050 [Endozoicomonas euniceicola]